MEGLNICRCCLTEGANKNIDSVYSWGDSKEIYSDMLQECFNIVLSSSDCNSICESCVGELRSSFKFRQQVLKCEQEFVDNFLNCKNIDEKPLVIKVEPGGGDSSGADESDDYLLVDIASKNIMKTVKREPPEHSKTSNAGIPKVNIAKKTKDGWRKQKIRNLVSKLATSINSCDIPDITTLNKKELNKIVNTGRKITISKDKTLGKNMEIVWRNGATMEKRKHKENLITILKFSNASLFKNKELHGYTCGYCESPYPDPADLRKHIAVDHEKDRLELKINFDLTDYSVKLDVDSLICTLCDESMDNLEVLKQHLIKMHSKKLHSDVKDHMLQFKLRNGDVYDCALCSNTYETFKMLKQHMNNHYPNYNCTKCESSFVTKRSLNSHKRRHSEGAFKCDQCEKVFSSKIKKNYHEKTKHLGARSISKCQYCNESFSSYYQRNSHLIKVHNSGAKYKCNVCDKSYVLKSLLMCHIKKYHLMERNFQCTECGFRFFSTKALKAHMVKHTGERNYVCEVCHKSYARKYTLREHLRIHNNDRRFKCDVCGLSFVQKCSLKSHLLSNHGISMAAVNITSS